MSIGQIVLGGLFTQDFLEYAIRKDPDWSTVSPDGLAAKLLPIFERFLEASTPNESQTEEDLIWPVLKALGWTDYLRQQSLSGNGTQRVPDGLLFLDEAAKSQANRHSEAWRRYEHGAAVVESKRWLRPLDRQSILHHEKIAPSSQMLRYLRLVDDRTNGRLRWGILTNGREWRLYFQGARSVSEQFFHIDLAAVLGFENLYEGDTVKAAPEKDRNHWLQVFGLMFGKDAFAPSKHDSKTFHQRALEQGKYYEERVSQNLSELVFQDVFPSLARGLSQASPDSSNEELRDAALILLYRLLFLFFAEDRNLLPMWDSRYEENSLRSRVRVEAGQRLDRKDAMPSSATRYWTAIEDLSRAVEMGDPAIGIPPYNGGLFDPERTPLLAQVRLGDDIVAGVIDALSYDKSTGKRQYINYRDLSVQQLGSIYERLLEFELHTDSEGEISVKPNLFARKSTGSYYTPDDLVQLVIRETLEPLILDRYQAFEECIKEMSTARMTKETRLSMIRTVDPATAILELKICDPAMGSGHFLVSLVDYLADAVINAIADAKALVECQSDAHYDSPLQGKIEGIRDKILINAKKQFWSVDFSNLEDRHIIRRTILKRCIHGVDRNEMAVELAKVSLWLHTFTVGVPLSFIDHHLLCGNSLFGEWLESAMGRMEQRGKKLLIGQSLQGARRYAKKARTLESIADLDIAEVERSTELYEEMVEGTDPLNGLMHLLHALEWLELQDKGSKTALDCWLDGQFGDPIKIAQGQIGPMMPVYRVNQIWDKDKDNPDFVPVPEGGSKDRSNFVNILTLVRNLLREEKFFHWEMAFPGVWADWETGRTGGFDAIIGNPPWDRIKLQPKEWFAARDRSIARATNDADRKRMIQSLQKENPDMHENFLRASARAATTAKIARSGGNYPLLSGGDINHYSLFVERGMSLLNEDGMLGLLTPSGIAAEKTSSMFFKKMSGEGRLKALYDFQNKGAFPSVDSSFKFCAFIASKARAFKTARCAFHLRSTGETDDSERCFTMPAKEFQKINPNTGTTPAFRSQRDARLTMSAYRRFPVLIDRSGKKVRMSWPVNYSNMLHLAADSDKFRNREQLEDEVGAWPVEGSKWKSDNGEWYPLYVGRMIWHHDHRAATVAVNPENIHNPALSESIASEQKADASFTTTPQFWVNEGEIPLPDCGWMLAFRDITNATNERTMVAAAIPRVPAGHTLGLILHDGQNMNRSSLALLLGNLNSIPYDYIARQKILGEHMSWYIVEQIPVVPEEEYRKVKFGPKPAEEIVRDAVAELAYTAEDMIPFAREMDCVDRRKRLRKPFRWNEERRLRLKAKLDAVYFHLYGVFDRRNLKRSRDDVAYIYSTFPILERKEIKKYGEYRTRDLALAYCSALAAGKPDDTPDA